MIQFFDFDRVEASFLERLKIDLKEINQVLADYLVVLVETLFEEISTHKARIQETYYLVSLSIKNKKKKINFVDKIRLTKCRCYMSKFENYTWTRRSQDSYKKVIQHRSFPQCSRLALIYPDQLVLIRSLLPIAYYFTITFKLFISQTKHKRVY